MNKDSHDYSLQDKLVVDIDFLIYINITILNTFNWRKTLIILHCRSVSSKYRFFDLYQYYYYYYYYYFQLEYQTMLDNVGNYSLISFICFFSILCNEILNIIIYISIIFNSSFLEKVVFQTQKYS